ncbi:MAG: hypothetical protein ABIT08_06810 [Bacteroidia bacterium]
MINKVSSVEELRAEKARLQIKKESLEDSIKDDVHSIKESLNPFNLLKGNAQNKSDENGILNKLFGTSLGFGLDFFVRRLFLKKSGFLKKAFLSLVINTLGSKVFAAKSGAILVDS